MKFFLIATLSLLISRSANAQNDSVFLHGTLSVQKGSTYKYSLTVALVKDKWVGYSLLDQGGPNETKSSAVVQFVKNKSSLLFAEKALLYSKAPSSDFCFVGGLLKMDDKKNQVKGIFLGRDQHNKLCGTGSVTLNIPESSRILMTPDGKPDTNSVNTILTRFQEERFNVKNGTVQLELWDGGVEDHDSLSIVLNDQVLQDAFEIKTDKKILTLNLKKGKNVLKIKALNEGTEPPNSARISVMDGDKKYALVSFLKKGEEAKVIIVY